MIEFNGPVIIHADDYHEFHPMERVLNIVFGTLQEGFTVEELGFDHQHVRYAGVVYHETTPADILASVIATWKEDNIAWLEDRER